jgi:hypothetical protein
MSEAIDKGLMALSTRQDGLSCWGGLRDFFAEIFVGAL